MGDRDWGGLAVLLMAGIGIASVGGLMLAFLPEREGAVGAAFVFFGAFLGVAALMPEGDER